MSTSPPRKNKDTKIVEFLRKGGRKGALADFNKLVRRASRPKKGGKSGN